MLMKVLFFVLVAITLPVHGQTACPVGVSAGSVQCGPSPANHVGSAGNVQDPQIRYVPTGKWISKWVAVAVDSIVGDIGAAAGSLSKREARRLALQRCRIHGAKKCEVLASYSNQCIALAWPTVLGVKVITGAGVAREAATASAISDCQTAAGAPCKIGYSDCSVQVFESFDIAD